MCVCAAPARLSNTILYAGIARRRGTPVHVMGYQNRAQNLAEGANCMLLHIPSAAPMDPDNMVDTSPCPSVLEDLVRWLAPGPPPDLASLGAVPGAAPAPVVHVFQKGIYTVVLSNRWDLAHAALAQVPARQRPAISAELLRFYGERFPGWHLALCCFDNREVATSTPLLWWYEPLFPRTLMAPAIDAHTGAPPDLAADVRRDHRVVFGAIESADGESADRPGQPRGIPFRRDRYPDDVAELMPARAHLHGAHGSEPNGDFLLDVASLRDTRPAVRVGLLGA